MSDSNKYNQETKLKHLFDGSDLNVYDSKVLNLGVGAPGADLLQNCAEIFKKATNHRLDYDAKENSSMLFQYGPTNGTFEARNAIAEYFSKMYGDEVKSQDIVITSGATQGLHVILSSMVDMNGFIFVDDVTYMIALDVIKQFSSLTIVPVRLTEQGVDVTDLECLLKQKQFVPKSKEFWGIYYTIPNYHNPTGIVFSQAICSQLIELARKYDFLIACDDVYNILNYQDDCLLPPKRLFAYDSSADENYKGHVVSNGSFSKIIGPGLRLGWLEAPARVVNVLNKSGICVSGGCLNNYTSCIVASLFELGLGQEHIAKLYAAYKERMLGACEVLQQNLPNGCKMFKPQGGYFIWITLPSEVSAQGFLEYCMQQEKIFFIVGTRFSLNNEAKNCIRISIAFHTKDKIVDGAQRLCAALQRYLNVK